MLLGFPESTKTMLSMFLDGLYWKLFFIKNSISLRTVVQLLFELFLDWSNEGNYGMNGWGEELRNEDLY